MADAGPPYRSDNAVDECQSCARVPPVCVRNLDLHLSAEDKLLPPSHDETLLPFLNSGDLRPDHVSESQYSHEMVDTKTIRSSYQNQSSKSEKENEYNQCQCLVNDKVKKKNTYSSYNSCDIVNETANTKSFKIPKITHNKENIDNTTVNDYKHKTFDIINETDTINQQHIVNGPKTEMKNFKSSDCSKNVDNVSNLNTADVKEPTEIKQSEVINSIPSEILCKSHETDMVFSNEINSIANTSRNSQIEEKDLINILKNPKLRTFISLFQDEKKMDLLIKMSEYLDNNINDDELKNKGILNKKLLNFDKNIAIKKKTTKNLNVNSSNAFLSCISVDNENKEKIKKKNNYLNEFNEGNTSSGNIYDHSHAQHKSESSKCKKSTKSYRNYKIIKDKLQPEQNDLKIVTAKFDKNISRIENCYSDTSSTSYDIKNKYKPMDDENAQAIKPKSVKFARQNLEIKKNNFQTQLENKNQITKIDRKNSKYVKGNYKKRKIISKPMSLMDYQPIVVSTHSDEISTDRSIEQTNPKTSNFVDDQPVFKKSRVSELDKLNADLNRIVDAKNILNTSNKRKYRTKTIDNKSNDIQNKNKQVNDEKAQKMQPRNPINLKLERKNLEIKQSHSQIELENKNQITKKDRKNSTSAKGIDKKVKTISKPLGFIDYQPIVVLSRFDEISTDRSAVQKNTKTSKYVVVNKPVFKKSRLSELDKLHADLNGIFDCNDIFNVTNKRQCRTNKLVVNVNTNEVKLNRKESTNIKHLDSNENQHTEFICCSEKLKKKVAKSTFKLNKNKHFVKKPNENKTLAPVTIKSAVENKMPRENECQQPTVKELIALSKAQISHKSIIYNECGQQQSFNEIPPKSNTNECLPELNICTSTPELTVDEYPPTLLTIDKNPPEIVIDKKLLESNMLQFSPERDTHQSPTIETRISTEPPENQYSEYTLKENSTKYVLDGLSCELINSTLLFKCSVSNCKENQFSTIIYTDFFKHIKINHQFEVWDGKCEACNHKLHKIPELYFMKNALEHLVSHHFVLKKNKQLDTMTNFGFSKIDQSLFSIRQNILKHIPFIEEPLMPLEDCYSPCDIISNQNLSIYQDSNNERFQLLSPQIFDVKSLNKGKVSTSNMNPSASSNSDLNIWMKVKTNYELVFPNPKLCLEAGQQIINNVVHTDDTICLIDPEYNQKNLKKVQNISMNVMKTQSAFTEMAALPRLLDLFKCMDQRCTKMFTTIDLFKSHMKLHFSNAEKKKKNQIYNVEQFKMCAYCFEEFDDEESLANHIAEKYSFCKYFCPHCFYRAYTASHVFVHQSIVHNKISNPCIIQLKHDDEACEYPKEILKVVDFKKFVLPYICSVGCCSFFCYEHNNFIQHLNQDHQQYDKFLCYICNIQNNGEGTFALCPNEMVTHSKLHHLNKYQCIFCLFGHEVLDSMIKHLTLKHFEYELLCLERSPVSDICDTKNIKNLKILKLKKSIDNGILNVVHLPSETRPLPKVLTLGSNNCSDVNLAPMKSDCINEKSQPSDTIDITLPDEQTNDQQTTLKITSVWSLSKIKQTEPQVSSYDDDIIVIDDDDIIVIDDDDIIVVDDDDIIVIDDDDIIVIDDDDDDDDLSVKVVPNEFSTKQLCLERQKSTNKSNKAKKLALPTIELDKLFVCKECDQNFSSGEIYNDHLKVCPFWNYAVGYKCMHCVKVFKTATIMTEHIKLHGPDRFKCYFCNLNFPSQLAIAYHMKIIHNIFNLNFVPELPRLTNLNKDYFIVFEDETVKHKKQNKLINSIFSCHKCSFKGDNQEIIISHMTLVHNNEQNVNCENNSNDKLMQEQPNDTSINSNNSSMPQQNTRLKRKRLINYGNQHGLKEKPILKHTTKIQFFSPDTIDSIPKPHIFLDPIGCLLCAYKTKVRSNLILHLNGHTKIQCNTKKEIFNCVPSTNKSDIMFDKMVNLSTSLCDDMNTEIMKRDELDKKIVEVDPDKNLNIDIFPQFIPKNIQFKCPIPLCISTNITKDTLMKHISILHPNHQYYKCPHCLPTCILPQEVKQNQIKFHLMHHGANLYSCQYCVYIDFSRLQMRAHMRNTHLSEITSSTQSNIIVIRQTMLDDESIDRAPYTMHQWVCNICCTSKRYTENEIKSHISMVHKLSNMFKCPLCQFEHKYEDYIIFKEHYKLKHPFVATKYITVFEKIPDEQELHTHSKHLVNLENIQEHRALESIDATLVPPTCRGIAIESTPLKSYKKSRDVPKCRKSTKSYPIHSQKQKNFEDILNKDVNLGVISANGHFVCPKCNLFETMNIRLFRKHLYKEVTFKTWKCLKCFEILDSDKKLACHKKNHRIKIMNEKIEDNEKLKWVDRVIEHQNLLLVQLNENSKAKHFKRVE